MGIVDPESGLEKESSEAARRICMSVEHAHTLKPFAAFHMSFALPVAFAACTDEERVWIHENLNPLFAEVHTRWSWETLHLLAVLITGVSPGAAAGDEGENGSLYSPESPL